MASFKTVMKSGHAPTLFAAFLYFDFCLHLGAERRDGARSSARPTSSSPAQKGLMLSVPIIAGALMRFPLGVLAQYIGRKNATLVEMGLIVAGDAVRLLLRQQLQRRARDGRAAGHRGRQLRRRAVARLGLVPAAAQGPGDGHRRAPATSAPRCRCWWRRRWRRPRAGRRSTASPAVAMLMPMVVMIVFAKEPPDVDAPVLRAARRLPVREGRLGVQPDLRRDLRRLHRPRRTSCPPTTTTSSASARCRPASSRCWRPSWARRMRVVGGWISDRWGGINTLTLVLLVVAVALRAVRRRGAARWRSPRCCSCSASPRSAPATARCSSSCRCAGR